MSALRVVQRVSDLDEPLELDVREGRVTLTAKQAAFFLSESKVSLALAGIRGGKTHAGALKTIFYALGHPCAEDEVHLVCSPTYLMSKVPVHKIFKLLYDEEIFPVCPLVGYSKGTRTFTLACEGGEVAYVQVVSLHDPDKVRGIKALSCWMDEGAYVSKDAWEILLGRLADVDGPAWITTTPDGHNWVYDEVYLRAVEEARAGVPAWAREYRVFHWASTENTYVPAANFEKLSAQFDPLTYKQEVGGLFVRRSGVVYYPFSRERHVGVYRVDPALPVYVGQDFNVDHMASSISQPRRSRMGLPGLAVVDEREARDSDTYKLAAWMAGWCERHRVKREQVVFYPDASGAARSTSGRSDHRILREASFRVDSPKANPRVKDRVNAVNGLLCPARGGVAHPRLVVDEHCVRHVECFEKQAWDTQKDPPEPDKENGYDHMLDACGYKVWRKFPIRASIAVGHTQRRRAA